MGDITDPSSDCAKGPDEMLPFVYEELRKLAAYKLAQERPGQTLQPTALVHEAWLKLSGSDRRWNDRKHFFRAAAEAMRRVLIDQVRRKTRTKRGGNPSLEELNESRLGLPAPSEEVLAVNDALDHLEREDGVAAQVVKLRYFVGMSIAEISEALDMSPRTIDRHWSFARAWLDQAIQRDLRRQSESKRAG